MDDIRVESRVDRLASGKAVVVATIHGRASFGTVLQIEKQVMTHFEGGMRHMVLDCAHLEYLNSTGTALLVKLSDTFRSSGGGFVLASVPEPMVDLMTLLGLLPVLEIAADVPEALRRLS